MQLKNNSMNAENRNELIRQIDKDDRIIEQTVVFLNRFDMEWKSKIQANLFQQFILGEFNWIEYCSVSQLIDSFTLTDLSTLEIIISNLKDNQFSIKDQENKNIIMDDFIHGSINRFVGFGLIYPSNGMLGGFSSYGKLDYKITELGNKLCSKVFVCKINKNIT